MRLARPRSSRPSSEDDRILPLINVVFLLLIFFMVVGSLSAADPFRIEPPQSQNGEAGAPRDVVLLIAPTAGWRSAGSSWRPPASGRQWRSA